MSLILRKMVVILDFGFWTARASARRNEPLYLLSAAHVNQKSSDMTTPNDTRSRSGRLFVRYRSRVARTMIT